MTEPRKHHSPEFKLKAVLEILKGEKTANQIAGELGIHPVALSAWKKQFTEQASQLFARRKKVRDAAIEKEKVSLYEQIGRLKMEVEWFKKNWVHCVSGAAKPHQS